MQHGLHRKQWDSTQRLVYATGMRLDECDQGLLGRDPVYFFKKHFLFLWSQLFSRHSSVFDRCVKGAHCSDKFIKALIAQGGTLVWQSRWTYIGKRRLCFERRSR